MPPWLRLFSLRTPMGAILHLVMSELSSVTTDTFMLYLILGTTIILMEVENPTKLYKRFATSVITRMHNDLS